MRSHSSALNVSLVALSFDELDPVEVALAADVADDRQVEETLQGGPEGALVGADVVEHALVLERVEVGVGDRGRDRVPTERVAVQALDRGG